MYYSHFIISFRPLSYEQDWWLRLPQNPCYMIGVLWPVPLPPLLYLHHIWLGRRKIWWYIKYILPRGDDTQNKPSCIIKLLSSLTKLSVSFLVQCRLPPLQFFWCSQSSWLHAYLYMRLLLCNCGGTVGVFFLETVFSRNFFRKMRPKVSLKRITVLKIHKFS